MNVQRDLLNVIVLGALLLVTSAPLRAEEAPQHVVEDLRYGEALFNFYQGKYFSSITNLMVAKSRGALKHQADDAEILLGGLYLGYGMHQQAGTIFNQLIDHTPKVDAATRDRAWFYLGKTRYQRGLVAESEEAFSHIKDQLPPVRDDERLNLLANLYLKGEHYEKAETLLKSFHGDSAWKYYAQFNLGVAMMKQGKTDEGEEQLDEVGAIEDISGREMKALRDKANLALGYALIRDHKPGRASKYFKRIRLRGPQSTKALLGMGWAYQSREMYRKALVPWMEIQSQSLLDPAVQEAILAIPYALEKLQKPKLALVRYNDAATRYENALRRFDAIEVAVQEDELISALQPPSLGDEAAIPRYNTNLPISITAPYIHTLMASQVFQDAFNKYQDLVHMRYVLDKWDRQLPVYKLMLQERRKAYQSKMPSISRNTNLEKLAGLKARRQKLASELEDIVQNEKYQALGTEEEKQVFQLLDKIGTNIARGSGDVDAASKAKYRILKGVMVWQLSDEYIARRWQAQKQLKQLDQALLEAERARNSLQNTFKRAPANFDDYYARMRHDFVKVKKLKKKINSIIASQEKYIKSLALAELNRQRLRLENYNMRAKFALARLYDGMAKAEGVTK